MTPWLIGTAALAWLAGYVCGIFAEQADNGVLRERWDDWRARRAMMRTGRIGHDPRVHAKVLGFSVVCVGCRHTTHEPGECYPGCRCGASR